MGRATERRTYRGGCRTEERQRLLGPPRTTGRGPGSNAAPRRPEEPRDDRWLHRPRPMIDTRAASAPPARPPTQVVRATPVATHHSSEDWRADKRKRVHELLSQTGMCGAIEGGEATAGRWRSQPSAEELRLHAALEAAQRGAVEDGNEDEASMITALGWLRDYQQAFPSKIVFHPMRYAGDIQAAQATEAALGHMAAFMFAKGSKQASQRGKQLSSRYIASTIGLLRTRRSIETGYDVSMKEVKGRNKRQLKAYRRVGEPAGYRRLERGFRTTHFERLLLSGHDIHATRQARTWHAVRHFAVNCLARGAEVGRPNGKPFRPQFDIHLGDVDADRHVAIEWHRPSEATEGHLGLTVWMLSAKNTHANKTRMPIPVRRRLIGDPAVQGFDPRCPYDAIWRVWHERRRAVPRALWISAPLFVRDDGAAVETSDVNNAFSEAAEAIGEDPSEFGGMSGRIGGATEIYHLLGEAGQRVIADRGRWDSDIAHIYQRTSASRQFETSALMGTSTGIDAEAFYRGWTQPARRAPQRGPPRS